VSRSFLSRFASPRSALIIGLYRIAFLRLAWLGYDYFCFASLVLSSPLCFLFHSILFYSITPYSCSDSIIVHHTAYCNGLAQLIY
jgi:hypothetical protein